MNSMLVFGTCVLHLAYAGSLNGLTDTAEQTRNKEVQIVNVCDETNSKNSFIYCYGRILEAVNVHNIYSDSKTFVDMPMKLSPNETLTLFNARFGNQTVEEINRDELKAFLDEYFTEPGTELEACTPIDWVREPPHLMRIVDPDLRNWALQLNAIWVRLCRKMKGEVNGDRHSLIYVPNEFIVPGGRFREFYYWDAYWIVKGLVASGMLNTAKAMIRNFQSVIDRFGFIPNGGRVYYLRRSQPPMLTATVYEYYEQTKDVDFLKSILPTLMKEFEFWNDKRSVNVTGQDGQIYKVYQYRTETNVPRPESFREDLKNAMKLPFSARQKFYQDIASAAESGWDFSTRWFSDRKSLITIRTTDIAPIDLNALMCWNMDILGYFFRCVGNVAKSKKFRYMREEFRYAMHYVFYNESEGAWFDYNIPSKSHSIEFYPSIVVPLFTECYQPLNLAKSHGIVRFMNVSSYDYNAAFLAQTCNVAKSKKFRYMREEFRYAMHYVFYNESEGAWFDYNIPSKSHSIEFYPSIVVPLFTECYQPLNLAKSHGIVRFMNNSGAFDYPGGVPSSLTVVSNQQWDFPNGWSPLNHMIIEGLRKSDNAQMQEEAFRLAQKWVDGNYRVFKKTGHMWEKYDVSGTVPEPGAGGEYVVQEGFGWTNGVILNLLTTYYNRLRVSPVMNGSGTNHLSRTLAMSSSSSTVSLNLSSTFIVTLLLFHYT
ncbi:Trehalase [Toxocara canis]|uniref:Trehalase n=1 Tax=Toxocara canis TaxID=6265 RepID=A0A0B2W2A3_TOXCA|nr:Trehalase [Toxocara canis]